MLPKRQKTKEKPAKKEKPAHAEKTGKKPAADK